jgi:O-antigen/teichoic acid export membrane protein
LEPALQLSSAPVVPWFDRHRLTRAFARIFASQKSLAGVAGWSFVAAVIARGSNLAAMILCARVLAQDQFGQVAVIQSTVGTFAPIAGLGLAITTTKFLAECRDTDPARAGRILALSLTAAALAGLAMTLVLIAVAPVVATRGFALPALDSRLIQASGLLMLGVIESVQTGALTGLIAFSRIAKLSMWTGVLSIPILGVLVVTQGVTGAMVGLTASLLLNCVLNMIALRAECKTWGIRPTLRGCAAERRILLNFSLPSYLSGILVAPVTWLTNAFLVKQPGGLSEIALFSAADRFRFLLIFLPLAVSRIAVPALSRSRATGDHSGYRDAFYWNVGFGLLATVPPALFCMALSGPLMSLFGETFRKGWPILAILAVSAIPTVMNTQLGAALLSNGRAWERTGVDGLLAGVFLLSSWWLIPRWNAAGLALSFALAYTAACVALCVLLRRAHAVR